MSNLAALEQENIELKAALNAKEMKIAELERAIADFKSAMQSLAQSVAV